MSGRKRTILNAQRGGQKTRIMTFGAFDVVHPGHLHFFSQARALAKDPYLIVSVARDVNVKRIKGTEPRHSERQRAAQLRKISIIDKVVLGAVKDYLAPIVRQRPNIIALGHDQTHYVRGLRTALAARGVKVKIARLKPHMRHKYRSSLYKENSKSKTLFDLKKNLKAV